MRTTIDLDPDVDARLRAIAYERGVSLRQAINDALRAGTQTGQQPAPFAMRTRRLGVRAGVDVDKALALATADEDAEIRRKLELRK